jgi:hypothetical protein
MKRKGHSHILALKKGLIPMLLPKQYATRGAGPMNSCVVSGLTGEAGHRQISGYIKERTVFFTVRFSETFHNLLNI